MFKPLLQYGGRVQLALGLLLALAPRLARAECMSLISGPVVYEVQGCKALEPEKIFDLSKEKYNWISGLDPAGRKAFYDSYRGLYLKGKVIKSKAAMHGVGAVEGALGGETAYMYIAPGTMQCQAVNGRRLTANLRQICCDGGGAPPCLLDTSYLLQQVAVLAGGSGDPAKVRAKKSKDYLAAEAAFNGHQWKAAAKAYDKARVNSELDVLGYYRLGYSYRMLDQCSDALPALRHISELEQKKQVWADDDGDAKKGTFLLARCYSKLNDASASVAILNSYLIEPERFRTELADSLKDADFGWIHTSKEYRDYAKAAKKKLSQMPAAAPAK